MAIILHHTNTPLPGHLRDCIAKIRRYSNVEIYLLTDSEFAREDVIRVDTNRFGELAWLNDLDYFRGRGGMSHMWRASCFRLFYIHRLMEEKNLKNVLHFDNDVLLFESAEKIIEAASRRYTGFAVTPHMHDEIVMGMCFIKDASALFPVVELLKGYLSMDPKALEKKFGAYPSEMKLISTYSGCQFLPVLPKGSTVDRYTNNFEHFGAVFDPSSYGQFLGGTFADKKPGWFGPHQEIGRLIACGNIKVAFEQGNPYIIYGRDRIKINNLHIHSKITGPFL